MLPCGHLLGKGWPLGLVGDVYCILFTFPCCDVYCIFVTFPCGILGQVWYLIVSFPDLCLLSYFCKYIDDSLI